MAPVSLATKAFRLSLAAIVIMFCLSSTSLAQFCEVVVSVGDTTAHPNTTNTVISVFVDNLPAADTIVAFNLWIQLDRPPDIMIFQTDSAISIDTTYWRCETYDIDSICIDSTNVEADSTYDFIFVDTFEIEIGSFDTTGTLIAGWEYVAAQSLSGNKTDLNLVGIADLFGGAITKGFAPQQGGLLIKLLADILNVSDTIVDRTVLLQINSEFQDNLNLVSTDPSWSIWDYEPFPDTNFWLCTLWAIDTTVDPPDTLSCLNWERVSTCPSLPLCSLVVILDSIAFLDTTRICLYNGELIVLEGFACGDLNGDEVVASILDLTYLIDFIFRGGPPPVPLCNGDLDCNGICSNILDLTYLIDFIFRGGPEVCLGC